MTITMCAMVIALIAACTATQNRDTGVENSVVLATEPITEVPYFLSVKEVLQDPSRPTLESFASGRSGDEVLLIGGRTSGFHGLINSTGEGMFPAKESNQKLIVLNISSGDHWVADIPIKYLRQFTSTNMEHCQNGDTLWLAGGYGIRGGSNANMTCDDLTALIVSDMISAVKAADTTRVTEAILYSVQDSFVQVTGGEMLYIDGLFYLVMGQNFEGEYSPGRTGDYTEAVRTFRIKNAAGSWSLSDKNQIQYSLGVPNQFHRRDLNVVEVISDGTRAFNVYGGVFTDDGNGWLNPIQFSPNGIGGAAFKLDTTRQLCNNYSCAVVPVYDGSTKSMYVSFLGGIGYMQWDDSKQQMVQGDGAVQLPFVKTISTLGHLSNGTILQHIQKPGEEPALPALLGAEAVFVPNDALLYEGEILDLSKCANGDSMVIGHMFGGIRATAPSSSSSYPTFGSNAIFEVTMHLRNTNE